MMLPSKRSGESTALSVIGNSPVEERGDGNNLGFCGFFSLFNIDRFAGRNGALLNIAFLHLTRFSTKTTDDSK